MITSCEKPSGEGGTSEINGNVTYFTTSYNAQTSSVDTNYYPKQVKMFLLFIQTTQMIYLMIKRKLIGMVILNLSS